MNVKRQATLVKILAKRITKKDLVFKIKYKNKKNNKIVFLKL